MHVVWEFCFGGDPFELRYIRHCWSGVCYGDLFLSMLLLLLLLLFGFALVLLLFGSSLEVSVMVYLLVLGYASMPLSVIFVHIEERILNLELYVQCTVGKTESQRQTPKHQ